MKRTIIYIAVMFMLTVPARSYQAGITGDKGGPGPSRVENLLTDIEKAPRAASGAERSATVTQAELNSYIVRQIAESGDRTLTSLQLKLLPGDKIEGRIVLDLRNLQIPAGLATGAEVLFSASFESRDGGIWITMQKVFLGGQPVSPQLIDTVIEIASRAAGYKPVKLGDRHKLPTGVKRLSTRREMLNLYY